MEKTVHFLVVVNKILSTFADCLNSTINRTIDITERHGKETDRESDLGR